MPAVLESSPKGLEGVVATPSSICYVFGEIVDVVAAVNEAAFLAEHVADRRRGGDDAFEALGGGFQHGWHGPSLPRPNRNRKRADAKWPRMLTLRGFVRGGVGSLSRTR